jgi:hypothetical protein
MRALPLIRRITHTDQVSALEIEAIELIACLLGVVYVLVDHECCAFGVVGNALTDLAAKGEKRQISGGMG